MLLNRTSVIRKFKLIIKLNIVKGIDGIGMIASEDGHNDAREAIFTRALLEIMQDQSMWKRIYDMENETNSFTNNSK